MSASHDEHEHSHSHAGHHHHGHNQAISYSRSFAVALILNSLFVVVEFGYGFIANSTALMADAGHNLSDVLGLVLAWAATHLAKRPPRGRYTYGLSSGSILAALTNAALLFAACGAIALEAIQRFAQPPGVEGLTVTLVATAGIFVNGISALLFIKGSKDDMNIRGAYLHMAADAAVSFGVVLAGITIIFTGWYWLDPVLSLVIVLVIVASTWGLLRDSLALALNAAPKHIDINAVKKYLQRCEGVTDVHDLHVWGMSTTQTALTVHLVMPDGYPGSQFLEKVTQELHHKFQIGHSTIQIEQDAIAHECSLHPG